MLQPFQTRARFFLSFALPSALACSDTFGPTTVSAAADARPEGSPASAPDPAAGVDFAAGDAPATCRTLSRTARARCDPSTPARAFSSALCSCEDTSVAGYLRTRGLRSAAGEPTAQRLAGSVGVNRSYITTGLADVGGSFAVAGARDVLFGGLLSVGEDLRFQPAFDVAGVVQIGRDAELGASLRAAGRIAIEGDLYRAPDSRFLGLALVSIGGEQYSQPISVAPPCACGASEILDIPALVADARTHNDNESVGLGSHALDLVVGVGTALTLPSGRYHLHQIAGAGALELHIDGQVSLFVDDDFYAGPLFRVSLAPDAELDLFVEDNLVLAGAAVIGDPQRPAATRIYAGGSGDIAIAGLNVFAGNVYAPRANVLVGGVGRVLGSLFGKNIIAAGFLDVGYDESVRDGHTHCSPPDGGDTPDTPGGSTPPSTDTPGDPSSNDPPPASPPGGDGDGGSGGDGPGSGPPGGEETAPPCAPSDTPIVR